MAATAKSRRVIYIIDASTQTEINGDDMNTLTALLDRHNAAAGDEELPDFDTFLGASFLAAE